MERPSKPSSPPVSPPIEISPIRQKEPTARERFTNNLPSSVNVQSPPLFTSPHSLENEFTTTESRQTEKEAQRKSYSIDEGCKTFAESRGSTGDGDELTNPRRPAGAKINWKYKSETQPKSKLQSDVKSLSRDLKGRSRLVTSARVVIVLPWGEGGRWGGGRGGRVATATDLRYDWYSLIRAGFIQVMENLESLGIFTL